MTVMNHSAFRHHFHSEASTREMIRDAVMPKLHEVRLETWLNALAEAYVEDGIEQVGSWYAAALDEIRRHASSELHERLAASDATKSVVKHCVSQEKPTHHLGIIQKLIDAGVSSNLKGGDDFAPLHYAASTSTTAMAEVLLKNGADLDSRSSTSVTAVMRAIWLNDIKMVKFLIDQGADVDATAGSGQDALLIAISAGRTKDILEAIVGAGADVNAYRRNGDNPILFATQKNHDVAIQYLVSLGVSANSKSQDGKHSALSIAVHGGHGDAVRALLECGADPTELKVAELDQYLQPKDVQYVRAFILEYGIFHAMDIPNDVDSVHNAQDGVANFPRKSSMSSVSPL